MQAKEPQSQAGDCGSFVCVSVILLSGFPADTRRMSDSGSAAHRVTDRTME